MKNIIAITIVCSLLFLVAFSISVGWEIGFQFATSTGAMG